MSSAVYVATLKGVVLGVFTELSLVSSSEKITQGYGVEIQSTHWGTAISTKQGIVEVRVHSVNPR